MTEITDEKLMAFVDGVLEDAERNHIATRVAASPRLARRLALFERTSPQALSAAFEPVRSAPVPQHLLDGLSLTPPQSPAATLSTDAWSSVIAAIKGLFESRGAFASHSGFGLAVPATLAVAAAVIFAARHVPESDAFRIALDTARSGETIRMAGSDSGGVRRLTPVLTFLSRDGRYCRRYRLEKADASVIEGVACRNSSARWMIDIEADGAISAPADAYASAGGSEQIDERIEALIEGTAFGRAEEDKLLRQGWR